MANSMDFCSNSTNASNFDGSHCPVILGPVSQNSIVSLDIDDVKLIAGVSEKVLMNTSITDSTITAAENAVYSSLIGNTFVTGINGIIVTITGNEDMSMTDIADAMEVINKAIGEGNNPNIIFGAAVDKGMKSKKKVTVLASGIKDEIWEKMITKVNIQ
jgi:cell division GTPase FtsZ